MKKNAKSKAHRNFVRKAEAAMHAGEPVYYMDGKQFVEAQIIQVDPDNHEFTVLLRLSKHAMKWVGRTAVSFGINKKAAEMDDRES